MVMITDKNGVERYSLSKEEDILLRRAKQKLVNDDQEVWIAFGGDTGTGKSLKAQHWLHAIHKDLALSQICFDLKEFIQAVIDAEKYTGLIADEGISIAFSKAAMTKEGRIISELANQIRQKNLMVIVCIPDVMDLNYNIRKKLDCYVEIWEDRRIINGVKRTLKGNASVYPKFKGGINYKDKIIEYFKYKRAKPLNYMPKPKPMFRIKGSPIGETLKKPWYPTGETEYRNKKESVLKKYLDKDDTKHPKQHRDILIRDKAIFHLIENNKITQKELANKLGMPQQSVSTSYNRIKAGDTELPT